MLRKLPSLFICLLSLFALTTAAQAGSIRELFHYAGDPVAGNPNGKVTVVEFFDYQCGHCISMAPVMSEIIKANPNVRVVFKDYPIRGEVSRYAARAALASLKQGKKYYYPFSHAMLENADSLTPESVLSLAKQVGLNTTQLQKDMKDHSVYETLNNTNLMAHQFDVNGTPAFFVGPTNAKSNNSVNFVLGEMSQSELQDAINKAGA